MDFMPSKRSDRYLWYKNLSANVVAEAVKFGMNLGQACPTLEDPGIVSRCQIVQQNSAKVIFLDQSGQKPRLGCREVYGISKQNGIFMHTDEY